MLFIKFEIVCSNPGHIIRKFKLSKMPGRICSSPDICLVEINTALFRKICQIEDEINLSNVDCFSRFCFSISYCRQTQCLAGFSNCQIKLFPRQTMPDVRRL